MPARILVVDPGDGPAAAAADLLREDGFEVTVARSGPEAIERAFGPSLPDRILLPADLPGMTGWEVLRALRGARETRDVPVTIVVPPGADREGGPGPDDRTDILVAPWSPAGLFDYVRAACDPARAVVRVPAGG